MPLTLVDVHAEAQGNLPSEANLRIPFKPLADWLEENNRKLINSILFEDSVKPSLLRNTVDLIPAWIESFPEDMRGEYACRTCNNFLNAVGSFVNLNPDLTITPLALPEPDETFDEFVHPILKTAYRNVRQALLESKSFEIITADYINEMSEKAMGNKHAGNFYHFTTGFLPLPLKQMIVKHVPIVDKHGYGESEVNAMFAAFNKFAEIGHFETAHWAGELRKSDVGTVKYITDMAVQHHNTESTKRSLFVRGVMIHSGLYFLNALNTVAGQLLKDILFTEVSVTDALRAYGERTDPRRYMRPTALPSEKQFEDSVKFLQENGYDKYLPLRLATMDDVIEHNWLDWKRPEDTPVDDDTPKDIFAKQRSLIKHEPAAKVKAEAGVILPTMNVSMFYFINEVLKKPEKIASIQTQPQIMFLGSVAIPQVQEGCNIYENGDMIRPFVLSQQVGYDHIPQVMSKVGGLGSGDVVGYKVRDNKHDDLPTVHVLFSGVTWSTKFHTPIFPETLIPSLRNDHRRMIEHWARTTPLNADETGTVVPFDDMLATVQLGSGSALRITFTDNSTRTYCITSKY